MFAKYQGVFRSRWKAVFWALGVCLTAYCTVPNEGEDNGDLLGGFPAPHAKASHESVDPWAVQKPDKQQG